MGCGASGSGNIQNVSKERRRLSVGEVDHEGEASQDDTQIQENRGAIQALSKEDVMSILSETSQGSTSRRFSLCSKTDSGNTSFANKQMEEVGDTGNKETLALGYTCRKGLKPESPNQDSWSIMRVDDNFSIYAVYDGHGQKGHDVSNFVKDTLPKLIIKDKRFKGPEMPKMLEDVFVQTQSYISTMDTTKKINAQLAGTTATVVIHDIMQKKLVVAHVADSTCVIGRWKDETKTELIGKQLTRDHKPDLKDERARIEKSGGRVVFDGYANYRVYAKGGQYPGLNMSRCLGDLLGHKDAGCIAVPEVNIYDIEPLNNVLLVCSDGVWEFIKPNEAVKIVMQFPPEKAQAAADKLAKEAWDRWMKEEGGQVVDDITVILVYLHAVDNTKS